LGPTKVNNIAELLAERSRRQQGRVIQFLFPEFNIPLQQATFPATHKLFEGADIIYSRDNYPKTLEFWSKGATYNNRLYRAGNRVGKTLGGGCEVAWHVTGQYPDFWEGKRFTGSNDWWVVGVSNQSTTEVLQPLLLGPVGNFGSGLIPRDCIDFETLRDAKKVNTPIGTVRVKHVSGGWSTITFKSYAQGRDTFQGTAKSIFLDEEPPSDIYAECLMRTMTGGNILIMTFTPLSGVSDVIKGYFPDGDFTSTGDMGESRWVTGAGMDDVKHLDEKKIQSILGAYPPYQRTARRYGFPTLEQGAIFPVDEELYVVPPFEIPEHWPRAYGLDVGRKTAAAWIAMDRETGVIYTYSDYLNTEDASLPSTHASSIAGRGKWIRGAIDTASRGRSATDGENLYKMYYDLGLHIQNADKAVETGLYEMLELLVSGRLKVFSTCTSLLKEIRTYSRDKNGKIIKSNDHVMDAWRYAIHTRDRVLWNKAEADAVLSPKTYTANRHRSFSDSWMAQ
jgi:phage terminase large subunit-like protein